MGLEYALELGNLGTATLVSEYRVLSGVDKEEATELTIFQNDFMLGFRHDFNNVNGSQLAFGVIRDLEWARQTVINTFFHSRFDDQWSYRVTATFIDAPFIDKTKDFEGRTTARNPIGLERFHDDHSLTIDLYRYF